MIFRLPVLLFSLLILCGCSKVLDFEDLSSSEISIAHLKSLCKGDHYPITGGYTIRGVVVATDELGEFNNSIVIVDRSGGLEIAVDSHKIAEALPTYSEVKVTCNGLMLARIGGKIELGMPPSGNFPLDNIDETMFERHIHILGVCQEFTPAIKCFSEIGVEDISAIIRFDNIRLCDEEQGLSWCDKINDEPITTYRTFIDREGVSFTVRTLASCQYAKEPIPTKEISVIGVIDYSNNRYFLQIANKWFTQ